MPESTDTDTKGYEYYKKLKLATLNGADNNRTNKIEVVHVEEGKEDIVQDEILLSIYSVLEEKTKFHFNNNPESFIQFKECFIFHKYN